MRIFLESHIRFLKQGVGYIICPENFFIKMTPGVKNPFITPWKFERIEKIRGGVKFLLYTSENFKKDKGCKKTIYTPVKIWTGMRSMQKSGKREGHVRGDTEGGVRREVYNPSLRREVAYAQNGYTTPMQKVSLARSLVYAKTAPFYSFKRDSPLWSVVACVFN